jgi:hypothetical protein
MTRLTDVPLLVTVPRFGRSMVSVDVDYEAHSEGAQPGFPWYTIEKVWLSDWDITPLIVRHEELEQALLRYVQTNAEYSPEPDHDEVMAEFMVPGDAA